MQIDKGSIEQKDWDDLLMLIKMQKCTPFVGSGASYPNLPMGKEVAHEWSSRYNYPLIKDSNDLAKVSQFMAIDRFPMFPKHILSQDFKTKSSPDFSRKDDPHGILADLNLPIYITTNYDNFMLEALKTRHKSPKRELCRWSSELEQILNFKSISPILKAGYTPTPEIPLVYHLHGLLEIPESIVMTENDYLDFMIRLHEKETPILPPEITIALATNALLFVGYSLADWDFRVLFRGIFNTISSMTNLIVAVQLRPTDVTNEKDAIQYLSKYFGSVLGEGIKVRVFWGEASEFAKELRDQWEDAS
jgi:SIR2-like protein